MQILHLSDMHIGKSGKIKRGSEAKRIVKSIGKKWGNRRVKPVILITGDIVDDGKKSQFKAAKKIFATLQNKGFKCIFIPGNHDHGWNGVFARKKNLVTFLKSFYTRADSITYPHIAWRGDTVTIIALNSMLAETGLIEGILPNGELGSQQLDRLDKVITEIRNREGKDHIVVVALHHHPFLFPQAGFLAKLWEKYAHCLSDGEKFMQVVKNRINVLLFGHEHLHTDFRHDLPELNLKEKYNIPFILCNGRSTDPGHPARLITLNKVDDIRVNQIDCL